MTDISMIQTTLIQIQMDVQRSTDNSYKVDEMLIF